MTDQAPQEGELILYRIAADAVCVEALFESETFWLDQRCVAGLFGMEIPIISYHLEDIHASGELSPVESLRRIPRVRREPSLEAVDA